MAVFFSSFLGKNKYLRKDSNRGYFKPPQTADILCSNTSAFQNQHLLVLYKCSFFSLILKKILLEYS